MNFEKIDRFLVPVIDRQLANDLSKRLQLRPLIAEWLVARGFTNEEEIHRFLSPRLSQLRLPEGPEPMAGFSKAVERINKAILQRERVGVFGDYDVDGITTCALLTDFLQMTGVPVIPRIAHRNDGYGFGLHDAQALIQEGCSLIITGDCGTSDHPTLAYCKEHGVDTIVVDHHQVPDRTPDVLALLNPHQPGCTFPFKGLASVGVAFYLVVAIRTKLKNEGFPIIPDPKDFLDLVALGTIADLSPLVHENRILVTAGLRELAQTRRPGLKELALQSGLLHGASHISDVGFRLAPRLNAPGRLGHAEDALGVLLEKNPARAAQYAQSCESKNQARQKIQKDVFEKAHAQAKEWFEKKPNDVLVVAGKDWHSGVVGIVASKLVDEFDRPAVVIAIDGEMGRGSARSTHGFHLYQGLRQGADFLLRYGGHAAAAGVSIHASDIDRLRTVLNESYRFQIGSGVETQPVKVDGKIQLEEIDLSLLEELSLLGPFGIGNPEPTFLATDVALSQKKTVGKGHLQFTLQSEGQQHTGIGFGLAQQARNLEIGHRVHAAFVPEIDTYVAGVRRVRLRLKSLVSADAQQD